MGFAFDARTTSPIAPPSQSRLGKAPAGTDWFTNPAWFILAAIVATAFSLQSQTFINHDVAWTLWGAGKMLHGAEFGRDIVEPNPPLVWYLSMPAAFLAERWALPVEDVFTVMVGLCALISIGVSHRILRRGINMPALGTWCFTLVAAAFTLIFCHRDFGQREHVAVILALPYLAAASARIAGYRLSTFAGAAIGLAAAAGLAQKPYFLAVPLCVEVLIFLRTRRPSLWWRPETITLGVAILAYLAVIVIATPAYLTEIVPMTRRIYWGFNLPLIDVAARALPQCATLCLALILIAQLGRPAPLASVMLAASFGFAFSYVVQMKAFSYHLWPLTTCIALGLAGIAGPLAQVKWFGRSGVALGVLAISTLTGAAQTREWWRDSGPGGAHFLQTQALIDVVRRHAGGARFMAISTHPYPGFPIALYAKSDWALRSSNQLFMPAVVRLRQGEYEGDPENLAFAESQSRHRILLTLELQPRVVIIDATEERLGIGRSDSDFLSFYLEDPAFRKAWARYREDWPIGGYRIFVLDGPGPSG